LEIAAQSHYSALTLPISASAYGRLAADKALLQLF
jgi:hypothetical protein